MSTLRLSVMETRAAPARSGASARDHDAFCFLRVTQIIEDAHNDRQSFFDMQGLIASIRAVGIVDPIIVISSPAIEGIWQIVIGHRRYRGAIAAGLDLVPAIICGSMDEAVLRMRSLVSNLQRSKLSAMELAQAFQSRMHDDPSLTHETLAQALGISRTVVTRHLLILKLPERLQKKCATWHIRISYRALAMIADVKDVAQQETLVDAVLSGESVRAIKRRIDAFNGQIVVPHFTQPFNTSRGRTVTVDGDTALSPEDVHLDLMDATEQARCIVAARAAANHAPTVEHPASVVPSPRLKAVKKISDSAQGQPADGVDKKEGTEMPAKIAKQPRRNSLSRRIQRLCGVALMMSMGATDRVLAQLPCQYEIVATIQGPNCGATGIAGLVPTAISPNGMYVTGWYSQCDIGHEAFLWIGPPPGIRLTIPRPMGVASAQAADVNDNGIVTGTYENWHGGPERGFVFKHASEQWIDLLPAFLEFGHFEPQAINNQNTVVGYRSIRNSAAPREAFVWNELTGVQGLGVMIGPSSIAYDISENGIVVGSTGSHYGHPFYDASRGFIHENGTTTLLDPIPGGINSVALHVNNGANVYVVGKTQSSPSVQYASFFYCEGAHTPVTVPNGFDAGAIQAMTDADFYVGHGYYFTSNGSRACVWQGNQYLILEGNITPLSINFNSTNYARGASLSGDVLVVANNLQNLAVGFLVRPLPPMIGDSNCDERVNVDDLLQVINTWGRCQDCRTDFDGNGFVAVDDLLAVILHWNP